MSITNPNIITKQSVTSDFDAYLNNVLTEFKSEKVTDMKTFAFRQQFLLKIIDCPNIEFLTSTDFLPLGNNSILEEIRLPSLQLIKGVAVNGQTKLKKVVFSSATKIDDSVLNSIYFRGSMETLEYADFSSLIHVPRASMYPIFYDCKALKTVLLDSAESIYADTFQNCTSLTHLDFPKLKLLTQGLCYNCTSLISVNLPEVIAIDNVNSRPFQGCASLTSINVPVMTDIGFAFGGLTAITTLDLPSVTKIPSSAFSNSTNFNTLVLQGDNLVPLDNYNAFNGTGITPTSGFIRVPLNLVSTYKSATNWNQFANRIFAIE